MRLYKRNAILQGLTQGLSYEANHSIVLNFGDSFGGGYYAGKSKIEGKTYAIIVAPKAQGEIRSTMANYTVATSMIDGLANTRARFLNITCAATQIIAGLNIGGYTDWHIPSWADLSCCYYNLKPGTNSSEGTVSYYNTYADPIQPTYSATAPKQTLASAFRAGGSECFDDWWYWSSSNDKSGVSKLWSQRFIDGYMGDDAAPTNNLFIRAIRKVLL